jgi:hypothetical protein
MTEPRHEAEPAAAHEAPIPPVAPAPPAAAPPFAGYPPQAEPFQPGGQFPPAGPFQPAWRPPREPWINPNRRAHVALVAIVVAAAVFAAGVTSGWVAGHRHRIFGPERGYPGYYRPGPPPVLLPWPGRTYETPAVPFPPVPSTSASAVPTPAPTATATTR